jgi:hypothetical protein
MMLNVDNIVPTYSVYTTEQEKINKLRFLFKLIVVKCNLIYKLFSFSSNFFNLVINFIIFF